MGIDSTTPVLSPLDKYDTHIHPVPSWVSTMQVPADIEVYMGIHGYHVFLNLFFFCTKNSFF